MFRFLCKLNAALLLSLGALTSAVAADWPEPGKTVQIVVPAPGGAGTGDAIARLLADQLGKRLKASFIIDNRGGANGNIGATIVAGAAPDGYKLLFSWAGTLAVNPSLYRNLAFDPPTSFAPIALIADVPNILVVSNAFPANSFAEFIAYAKSHPGAVNFGSTGHGSSMHLAAELVMAETATKMTHIPYSAPGLATTNLIANDIQAMFQLVPGVIGQIKGNKVRAIAIMSEARSPALPDVPTTTELGYPKLLSSTWFALLAPKNTPPAILDQLNSAVNEILKDPEVKKRLNDMGASPTGGTRQALADHLAAETVKWRKIIRASNIQMQ